MVKNRDWQKHLVPTIAKFFYENEAVTKAMLCNLLGTDADGDISTSDRQAIKKYRDWCKAQVLSGKKCLVGGKDGPTATDKALSARQSKSAVLSFDALNSAIEAMGMKLEGGAGREVGSLDFDFLDDEESGDE